jgi:hypothetical protein
MEEQKSEPQLFNYAVNLEKRVRVGHPPHQVKAAIDFSFATSATANPRLLDRSDPECCASFGPSKSKTQRRRSACAAANIIHQLPVSLCITAFNC